MKYIVIKARDPQDGSAALQARVIFPDWMSPTLVCAGIIGRVQELSDGGIIEEGSTVEHSDDAYREGMQAARNNVQQVLHVLGMPEGTEKPMEWLRGEFAELGDWRKGQIGVAVEAPRPSTSADYEDIQRLQADLAEATLLRKRDKETIQQLNAELGASQRVIESLEALNSGVADTIEAVNTALDRNPIHKKLNDLMEEFGALPGQDREYWLRRQLTNHRTLAIAVQSQGYLIKIDTGGNILGLHRNPDEKVDNPTTTVINCQTVNIHYGTA